jgi:hypothetical protein
MKKPADRKRPLRENADFDAGHGDPARLHGFRIDSFDFKGRADMKIRNTGNYADNAMHDYSRLNEEGDESILDRLQQMLAKADVSEDEMRAGVRLTDKGRAKAAGRLGVSPEEVDVLLNSLATRMRKGEAAINRAYAEHMGDVTEAEGEGRYTYEDDYLGNVTVRDIQTGKERFMRGHDAQELLQRLNGGEDEQEVLGGVMALVEGDENPDMLDEDGEDPGYEREMKEHSRQGSYNFPWKEGGKRGTATAEYRWMGENLKIDVRHIRDSAGEPINDAGLAKRLAEVARGFIGRE